LYSFILVFSKVFCGLHILLISLLFSNGYSVCYQCPLFSIRYEIS
jgi:hypothetical protein